MSGKDTDQRDILPSRALDTAGLPRFLDAVACPDGRVRLFFGGGAVAAAVMAAGIEELREVAGGLMVAARGRAGDFRLTLADGSALVLPVAEADRGFDGRRVLLLMRVAETAEAVAEGIVWHAHAHGAEAALVVNRAPEAGFAGALAAALGGAVACRVVDLALPSGKADTGPETHPFLAPDAPGKDRMTPPEADPWRAPLDEGILYELMKWRHLAGARSVVSLEACDLIPAPEAGAPTVFAAAEGDGAVMLAGRRCYPWRLRPGRAARFGDHICRMFDSGKGTARWACVPGRTLDKTWRQTRISYVQPKLALPFWRAMALRVTGAEGQPLAPKTALIEDAGLLALSANLGAKPVRQPASAVKAAPAPATGRQRVAIVTTMKNEGPFILEWIAYHRAIGVTDFLIYTNDCTDGTDTMLQMLMRKGLCQWRENPFRDGDLKPQHAALQAAEDEAVMREADWAVCMDVDEFIDIKIGDGTLPALFAAMEGALPGANMVAMTWRLFGNSEVHGYEDRFLLEQFTRCAPEVVRKPHQAWGFKTLFRTLDIYKKLGVHRPKGLRPDLWDQVRWLNGSGRPLPKEMFRNGWRSTMETYGYDWVQLNHYAVRSAESFLVKRDRGRVNHVDRDQGLNYWFRMNHNVDEDRSIQRMIPALQAEWDRLMADPDIRAAHEFSVRCHRDKITELRATENYERFYGELTGKRMERLCRMQAHFGSAVFAAGPGVIPPDLHEREVPPDFFFTVEFEGEAEH